MAEHEPDGEPEAQQARDEVEVTELRQHAWPASSSVHRVLAGARRWRRLAFGLSLALLLALLLSRLPLVDDALRHLVRAPAALSLPTLPDRSTAPLALPSPSAPLGTLTPPATPTVVLDATGHPSTPTLDPAPAACGQPAPTLTHAGPPLWADGAIGQVPVRLAGFIGPYATLRLGPAASANAYGWAAPYSRYGWPAPIVLVVSSFDGPVTLRGWAPGTDYPLWFGFVEAGVWGAPTPILPVYTLDPANLTIPAGGSDATDAFWYGYVFLPGAGCYVLAANWPGGSWLIAVSAGR